MKSILKIRQLFCLAVLFQFLMSTAILFAPLAVQPKNESEIGITMIGLLFWGCAIAAWVLVAMANAERKKFIFQKTDGDMKMNCGPGILEFFSNVPATVADVALILSLFLCIGIGFTSWKYEYISCILIFILIFSLHMHCMFNGRIYKATKIKRTRR